VLLRRAGGRLIAEAPPELAGLLELRGHGIVRLPFERRAVVRLVVDLVPDGARLLEEEDRHAHLCGVEVPRMEAPGPEIAAEQLGFHIEAGRVFCSRCAFT
jgi:serine kinase of HPr protein (carbohydrate metabolism regulator)